MAPPKDSGIRWTTILSWLLGLPAGLAVLAWLFMHGHPAGGPEAEAKADEDKHKDTVEFPKQRWETSGIALEETKAAPFVERHWRPGRLAVDESRVAHLSPVVDGVIREVRARLGQKVSTGEVLAILKPDIA